MWEESLPLRQFRVQVGIEFPDTEPRGEFHGLYVHGVSKSHTELSDFQFENCERKSLCAHKPLGLLCHKPFLWHKKTT